MRIGNASALAMVAVSLCIDGLVGPAHAQTAVEKSQPYLWRNVAVIAGGFVDGLIFSPARKGLAFARTDIGGAYRWDAGPRRWTPLNDWAGGKDGNLLGCESIGVDPSSADRFYLALGTYTADWSSNGAIMRTADGGKTWKRTDVPFKMGGNEDGRSAGERLQVDPNLGSVLLMGTRNNGLWRSDDGGARWAQVTTFPVTGRTNGVGVVFEVFDRRSGPRGKPTPVIYAAVSQQGPGLYRSADGGATWQPVAGQPTGLLPHQGAMAADGSLILTYGDAPGPNGMSGGAVWKLDTRAGTWKDITPSHGSFGYAGLALDLAHPGTLMVSTMDRWSVGDTLFRSRDGGATWSDIAPKGVNDWSLTPYLTFGGASAKFGWWIGALAIDPFEPGHVLYGTGATVWASDDVTAADSGKPTHWKVGAAGIEETAVITLVSPPAGAHLLSGMGDIGGFRHTDLTLSPAAGMFTNPVFGNADSIDVAELAPDIVVRVGRGGRQTGAISHDNGATWKPFLTEPVRGGGQRGGGGGSVALGADGAAIVWLQGGALSYSHDGGATWQACAGAAGPRGDVVADRKTPGVFYAMAAGKLVASTDAGATFAARGALPKGSQRLKAAPGRAGDLWVTCGAEGVYHSTDGGTSFVRAGELANADQIGFGRASPGHEYPALYVTGQTRTGASGVFRSDDIGATWVRINDDAHQYGYSGQAVTGDPRIYGRVYMGSNGRGILAADPAPR